MVKKKKAKKKKKAARVRVVSPKRLYRGSKEDSIIGGVCAGLGEYYNADPVIFRILAIVLALLHGIGILVYLIMWLIVPRRA